MQKRCMKNLITPHNNKHFLHDGPSSVYWQHIQDVPWISTDGCWIPDLDKVSVIVLTVESWTVLTHT